MGVVKSKSGNWVWDPGERFAYVAGSCHHLKDRDGYLACGGCYVRAIHVLSTLAAEGVTKAQEFMDEAKAESAALRATEAKEE